MIALGGLATVAVSIGGWFVNRLADSLSERMRITEIASASLRERTQAMAVDLAQKVGTEHLAALESRLGQGILVLRAELREDMREMKNDILGRLPPQ